MNCKRRAHCCLTSWPTIVLHHGGWAVQQANLTQCNPLGHSHVGPIYLSAILLLNLKPCIILDWGGGLWTQERLRGIHLSPLPENLQPVYCHGRWQAGQHRWCPQLPLCWTHAAPMVSKWLTTPLESQLSSVRPGSRSPPPSTGFWRRLCSKVPVGSKSLTCSFHSPNSHYKFSLVGSSTVQNIYLYPQAHTTTATSSECEPLRMVSLNAHPLNNKSLTLNEYIF